MATDRKIISVNQKIYNEFKINNKHVSKLLNTFKIIMHKIEILMQNYLTYLAQNQGFFCSQTFFANIYFFVILSGGNLIPYRGCCWQDAMILQECIESMLNWFV